MEIKINDKAIQLSELIDLGSLDKSIKKVEAVLRDLKKLKKTIEELDTNI
jgi:hypothetical protein